METTAASSINEEVKVSLMKESSEFVIMREVSQIKYIDTILTHVL